MQSTPLVFLRAMVRALRDSNETQELLVGEEISSIARMRHLVPLMKSTPEGRAVLRERPHITTETTDFDALASLPVGTLGRAYAEHVVREGLDPDALATPVTRGETELDNYMLERIRQTHDIWHTMLGLGTAGHEEVLVHAFQWPQLRMPYSALVVGFGTVKHLVGEARWEVLRHELRQAWQAGRDAAPLLPIYWEQHWEESIDDLRRQLGLTNVWA